VTFNLSLKSNERAAVHTTPDGPLDGSISRTSSNPGVATIGDVFNPADFFIVAQSPGSAVVTINATSAGVPLSDTVNVTVTGLPATTLGTVIDAPILK
jgi:hypothetical protein